jgi:hypothetical protein
VMGGIMKEEEEGEVVVVVVEVMTAPILQT